MRKRVIALLGLLLPPVYAANSEVYMVMATDCGLKHNSFVQTGFRARIGSETGLVTALHGVVGCKMVTARHESRHVYIQDLRLPTRVDVDRDVAFFTSPTLLQQTSPALVPIRDNSGRGWKVVGHPQAVLMQLSHDVALQDEARVQLRRLMPVSGPEGKLLENRKSPILDSTVFSLTGAIQPGYSGAPILNAQDRVVAVAQGGLAGGFADINWAVPIMDVNWKAASDPSVEPRLATLANLSARDLFATAFSSDLEQRMQSGGATITGRILYNGDVATRVTRAFAAIELMDAETRQEAPANAQYDNQTGIYVIRNVPPGKYTTFIRLEAGYPFGVESGGDFFDRLSGMNDDIVVAPQDEEVRRDLKVVQVIHLTKPVDNQQRRRSTDDPRERLYPSFYGPSADVFEWDPVPGATTYRVDVLTMQQGVQQALKIDERYIETNKFQPGLGVSAPGTYYMFSVIANNARGELIGNYIEYFKNGSGGWFEFVIIPPPQ